MIYTFRSSDAIDDVRWILKMVTYAQAKVYGRMDHANNELGKPTNTLVEERLKKLKRLTAYPPMGPEAATRRE